MFSQNELMLMIFVVGVLLVFIVVLTILDLREYRKLKNEDEEFKPEKEEPIQEIEKQDSSVEMEFVQEPKEEQEMEVLVSEVKEDDTPFVEEDEIIPVVQENVEPIRDVVEEVHEEVVEPIVMPKMVEEHQEVHLDEELDKISETIVDDEKKVVSFEEEQERTAIISLDELMNKSDNLYNANEINQYNDDDEPISLDEVFNMYQKEEPEEVVEVHETPKVLEEVMEEKKELYTKKESVPFISSLYGLEKNDMSFENTASYEKLNREQSNEFMRKLREMSENK